MDKPTFNHGCRCCTFLGSMARKSQRFDLYWCNGRAVARYGNEPEDFDGFRAEAILRWGPEFRRDFPAVAEAYRRAKEQRFL
ncbi:MAG: hypothetical protein L0387_02975 [Acidobacteria bacterium]|nr:hypothetical protein [Acidobacteriota bacterium]MCI0724781.1 hypothetical protein [Acidobacteriota bacterium]